LQVQTSVSTETARRVCRLSDGDHIAPVAMKNGLFFRAGGNGSAPVATNYGLPFLASDA